MVLYGSRKISWNTLPEHSKLFDTLILYSTVNSNAMVVCDTLPKEQAKQITMDEI